jgi:hypothetical protein
VLYITLGAHIHVSGSDVQSVKTVSRKVYMEYVPTGKLLGRLVGEARMTDDIGKEALADVELGRGEVLVLNKVRR